MLLRLVLLATIVTPFASSPAAAEVWAADPAVKEVTTASYDVAYVDNIVAALIEAGAQNTAPADADYEYYSPGVVSLQSTSADHKLASAVLVIHNGLASSSSKPLQPALVSYMQQLLASNAGCKAGYPVASLACMRTVDLERSYCTASYQCLKAP